MAFEEYDDFEQERVVKDWIKSNWLTIVTGIALGLGGVLGLNFWKVQKQESRYLVANKYESFTEVMKLSQLDEAQSILSEMESDSGSSFYTYEARLILAKEFIEKDELDKAVIQLQHVVDSKPDQLMTEFVKLRLARVYNAMGKNDEALSLVNAVTINEFASIAKEIQGDALLAQGNSEKANGAFKEALEKGEGYSGKKNIEMKLENS